MLFSFNSVGFDQKCFKNKVEFRKTNIGLVIDISHFVNYDTIYTHFVSVHPVFFFFGFLPHNTLLCVLILADQLIRKSHWCIKSWA